MPGLWEWFPATPTQIAGALLSVVALYAAVFVLTRIFGLRSFSKMSTGDFVVTVAIGSLFGAAIASPSPTAGVTAVAFLGLYCGKFFVAWLKRNSRWASRVLDNRPLLLMRGSEILHDNLDRAHVSEGDLRAKLREANVLRLEQVQAVVFETTGDVSVLHADDDTAVEPWLLEGVVGGDEAAGRPRPEQA